MPTIATSPSVAASGNLQQFVYPSPDQTKTKQNKTNQNKTKQNKTKQTPLP
jgi:hypothetical protein